MSRFKDFGAGQETTTEPLSFALYGETFECYPALQGKFLLDLVASSSSDDPGSSAAVVSSFFSQVLVPESYERFQALSVDPERIVSVETLGEVTGWLVSEYSSRPTTAQENSSSGE